MGVTLDYEKLKPAKLPAPEDDLFEAPIFVEWNNASKGERADTNLERISPKHIPGFTGDPYSATDWKRFRDGGISSGWLIPIGLFLDPPGDYFDRDAARVIEAFKAIHEELTMLSEAARRTNRAPFQWPIFPEDANRYGWTIPISNLARRIVGLRARAYVQVGSAEKALHDVVTLLRLAHHLEKPDGHLIGTMIATTIHAEAQMAVFAGLKARIWTEQQLRKLDTEVRRHDLVSAFPQMVQHDVAFSGMAWEQVLEHRKELWDRPFDFSLDDELTFLEKTKIRGVEFFWKIAPEGFHHQNFRHRQETVFDHFIAPKGRLSTGVTIDEVEAAFEASTTPSWSPFAKNVNLELENYAKTGMRVLYSQQMIDLMRTAIALERWWLANHDYPNNLTVLVPSYLPDVPQDHFEPTKLIRYEQTPNGRYKLWSSNRNRLDEGGLVTRDWTEGDIVWQYQTPPTAP